MIQASRSLSPITYKNWDVFKKNTNLFMVHSLIYITIINYMPSGKLTVCDGRHGPLFRMVLPMKNGGSFQFANS